MTTTALPMSSWEPAVPKRSGAAVNVLLSLAVVSTVTMFFLAAYPACRHWFALPTAVVGVLIGADVMAWLRRQVDVFDPGAIIAVIAFHNYFVAPFLHVAWDVYDPDWNELIAPSWQYWFTPMTALAVLAWLGYKVGMRVALRRQRAAKTVWVIEPARFSTSLAIGLVVSTAASLYVFIVYQGLSLEANLSLETALNVRYLSWVLMLGQPMTFLLVIAIVQLLRDPRRMQSRSLVIVLLLIVAAGVVQFILVGMRGSRTGVFYPLFLISGVIHYRYRRFTLPMVLAGLVALFMFVYMHGFIKRVGSEGFRAFGSAEARTQIKYETGHSMAGTLLGDFARADVQAYMLFCLKERRDDYRYRWGWTYAAAVLVFIPRAIWPTKPYMVKGEAGTALQYGEGLFDYENFTSSRIYGLYGEAMLNFGPWAVPLVFLIFGYCVGRYRQAIAGLDASDARFLLVPIVTLLCMNAIIGDSDN
jgi:hypothetical protein